MSDPTDTGGVLLDRQIARDDESLRAEQEYREALKHAVEDMDPEVIRAAWGLAKAAHVVSSWDDWYDFIDGLYNYGLHGSVLAPYLRGEVVVGEYSGEHADLAFEMAQFAGIYKEITDVIKEAGQ